MFRVFGMAFALVLAMSRGWASCRLEVLPSPHGPAIRLENERVTISVVPRWGGRVLDFVDRKTGMRVFATPETNGQWCGLTDYTMGDPAWKEATFEHRIVRQTQDEVAVELWAVRNVKGHKVELRKTVSVRSGERGFRLTVRCRNLGARPIPNFTYGTHPEILRHDAEPHWLFIPMKGRVRRIRAWRAGTADFVDLCEGWVASEPGRRAPGVALLFPLEQFGKLHFFFCPAFFNYEVFTKPTTLRPNEAVEFRFRFLLIADLRQITSLTMEAVPMSVYRPLPKNLGQFWGGETMAILYFTGELTLFSERPMKLIHNGWRFAPKGGGRVYGAGVKWPEPLEPGYEYSFKIRFGRFPHLIVIDGNVVWDCVNGWTEGDKATFTYIPTKKSDNVVWFVIDKDFQEANGIGWDDFFFVGTGWSAWCWRRKFEGKPPQYRKWHFPKTVKFERSKQLIKRWEHLHHTPAEWDRPPLKKPPWETEDIIIFDGLYIEVPEGAFPEYFRLLGENGVDALWFWPGAERRFVNEAPEETAKFLRVFCAESTVCGEWWWHDPQWRKLKRKVLGQSIRAAELLLRKFPHATFYFWMPEITGRQWQAFNNPEWAKFKTANHFARWRKILEINRTWRDRIIAQLDPSLRPRAKMIYQTDCAGDQMAYFYEGGADLTMNKIIHRQNANIVIASARGAARAYHKPFGLEYDPWCGVYRLSHHPDEYEHIFRVFYFAGANAIFHESVFETVKGGHVVPNVCGVRYLDAVRFMRTHPKRGEQLVRIGVLRGWGCDWGMLACEATGGGWSSERKVERFEDYNLLDVFFPEYGWYWRTRLERLCTGTPFGQVDFVPWSAPVDVLRSYELLVYLGLNGMDEAQARRLEEYVKSGGTLVMALGQWRVEGAEPRPLLRWDYARFLGVDILRDDKGLPVPIEGGTMTLRIGRRKLSGKFEGAFKIAPHKCEVIGRSENGDPIVTVNKFGRGKVYFFATEFLSKVDGKIVRELLRHLAEPCKLVDFAPPSDWLEYFVWRKGKTVIVPIFNHGRIRFPSGIGKDHGAWRGKVIVNLRKILGGRAPREVEAFTLDMTERMEVEPIDVRWDGVRATVRLVVDRRVELVIGPKGRARREFFGASG